MIEHTINPVLFEIGGFEVRYYGLMYIIGFVLAYFIINLLVREQKINLSKEQVMDYIVYLGFGLLIGARIFYFVFYQPATIVQDPLEVLKLWHGGMSFHGGLIGAIIAGYIFCRRNNVSPLKMADITVVPAALALAFGRLGNFINGELVGTKWDGALCIDYSNNPHLTNPPQDCRFPSQIAESLKNVVIFASLWLIKSRNLPTGFLFWTFITMYGVFRFFIEFVRVPDFEIGWFSMGQVLCLVMVIIGTTMLVRMLRK